MASKIALVGLVILVVGLIIGIIGAASPVSGAFKPLLSTTFNVDGNGYQSKNLNMSQGQTIQLSVSIANNTLFNFYIMNQTNYYAFYGCAPACHAAPNVTNYGPVPPQNLSAPYVNATVSPSSTYTTTFTAPAAGTYYFIFDNSEGPNWATYINQNATGPTTVTFQISQATKALNWAMVGPGVALLIIGGAIATATWEKKQPPKSRPITSTSPTTPPPSTPASS